MCFSLKLFLTFSTLHNILADVIIWYLFSSSSWPNLITVLCLAALLEENDEDDDGAMDIPREGTDDDDSDDGPGDIDIPLLGAEVVLLDDR